MLEILRTYGLVFLLSMAPVFELRGSIPAGMAMGLDPVAVYLTAVAGNMLPVPLILIFIRRILAWMRRREGVFARFARRLERKAAKGAQKVRRYALFGLFILVAIPLPGTGAWTGALVAALMELRMRSAIPVIFCGVAVAGIAMIAASLGVIHLWL